MRDNEDYTVELRGEDLDKATRLRGLESGKKGELISLAEAVRIAVRNEYERRLKDLGGKKI